LFYVSREQVNAVVPYGVQGGTSTQVMVESQGQTSAPITVPVKPSSPGIFTLDSSGHGHVAALNEDGSLNLPDNPAARESVVSIFATGEGQTNPPGVNGKLGGSPLPVPVLPVQLFIGDAPTDIKYVGGAPGEIAGVLQINARVPATIQPGQQKVVLQIGEATSQEDVFIVIA
jgi:uncharacterized protein (TIGR03437 family)